MPSRVYGLICRLVRLWGASLMSAISVQDSWATLAYPKYVTNVSDGCQLVEPGRLLAEIFQLAQIRSTRATSCQPYRMEYE